MDFLDRSVDKESAYNAGDPGSIPGSEGSPGEGIGYPLQYSCLGNPMDRGAWRATGHGTTHFANGETEALGSEVNHRKTPTW